ncbi:MAG: Uncharacterised protein [Halieaceae bacterium]|nr:MAG: Uncharacterised protein [Halieaceae bacterium]
MREQSVQLVLGREVKVRDGLFGFGQPARNRFAGRSQRDDLDALRCTATASCCRLHILVGNAAATPGTGDGAQIDTQLVCQSTHAGR